MVAPTAYNGNRFRLRLGTHGFEQSSVKEQLTARLLQGCGEAAVLSLRERERQDAPLQTGEGKALPQLSTINFPLSTFHFQLQKGCGYPALNYSLFIIQFSVFTKPGCGQLPPFTVHRSPLTDKSHIFPIQLVHTAGGLGERQRRFGEEHHVAERDADRMPAFV